MEGEGRINWQAGKFRPKNKQGGCNKQGCWQKSPELINREVGINEEAGKNTAIRNFIEIKSLNNLVKISTKRTEIQRQFIYMKNYFQT